jgi:RluA family pseudouridine synthase
MDFLHSDDSILVLNKPAGLSVLPEGWNMDAPYLVKILEEKYPRIWVVHRLDKVTSGVMVFALTAEVHRDLNIQFEKHRVEKKYHAIANGVPAWEEKTTKHRLRINVGHRHRTVVDPIGGKKTETRFKVLGRYPAHVLFEAQPMTGRTHQIRVHAMAMGHPLMGDLLYNAPATDWIARPALHAYSLSFTHPGTKDRLTFTAPYPDDFRTAMNYLERGGE